MINHRQTYTKLISITFLYSALLILLLVPAASLAQQDDLAKIDCSVPQGLKGVRPRSGGPPEEIKIGLYVIDIKGISDIEQTYDADFFMVLSWSDPRLSKAVLGRSLKDCRILFDEIWHPLFLDTNSTDGKLKLKPIVDIDDEGNAIYRQRYVGELKSDLHFKDFPYDSQVLHFTIVTYGADSEDINFVLDEKYVGMFEPLSLEGWDITLGEPVISKQYVASVNKEISRIDFQMLADRHPGFYLWKVIVPLCLIALMAWTVFWIDPSQVGPQIGLSTATIFTLIAYRFSLGFTLPKISYFTRVDTFVLFATVLVFATLGVAIATSRIAISGNKQLALRIEDWAKVIYLVIFILLIFFTLIP
jgi:hypothetical protein